MLRWQATVTGRSLKAQARYEFAGQACWHLELDLASAAKRRKPSPLVLDGWFSFISARPTGRT
ncbi:hypothetical protein [Pseudomonas peli]|uniref:hypothetical protein n=1 Tax=Pseudomonas peli TaxID=592361 RepID=UPI0024ACB2F4|nr:hypothetical protein [Pseudomonas peli]